MDHERLAKRCKIENILQLSHNKQLASYYRHRLKELGQNVSTIIVKKGLNLLKRLMTFSRRARKVLLKRYFMFWEITMYTSRLDCLNEIIIYEGYLQEKNNRVALRRTFEGWKYCARRGRQQVL